MQNPSSVIDRQKIYIWQAGYYTIVHLLGEDLTVLWDRKTTVHIQAGPRWQVKKTYTKKVKLIPDSAVSVNFSSFANQSFADQF